MWPFTGYVTNGAALRISLNIWLLTGNESYRIMDCARAVLIKGNLTPEDLPTAHRTKFCPPEEYEIEKLNREYNLTVGEPLQKPEALAMFCELHDLGIRFEEFNSVLYAEIMLVMPYVDAGIFAPCMPLFGPLGYDKETVLEVLQKWRDSGDREMEVRQWLEKSSPLVEKVEQRLKSGGIIIGGKVDNVSVVRRHRSAAEYVCEDV